MARGRSLSCPRTRALTGCTRHRPAGRRGRPAAPPAVRRTGGAAWERTPGTAMSRMPGRRPRRQCLRLSRGARKRRRIWKRPREASRHQLLSKPSSMGAVPQRRTHQWLATTPGRTSPASGRRRQGPRVSVRTPLFLLILPRTPFGETKRRGRGGTIPSGTSARKAAMVSSRKVPTSRPTRCRIVNHLMRSLTLARFPRRQVVCVRRHRRCRLAQVGCRELPRRGAIRNRSLHRRGLLLLRQ
mmetsp:Transcript_21150/g.53875  ORF Transcript_21150/g.53875 Transcript_21150/m.53875 type:complete len:242 (+) Transcript_21150:429-1154(+)